MTVKELIEKLQEMNPENKVGMCIETFTDRYYEEITYVTKLKMKDISLSHKNNEDVVILNY